MRKNDKRYGFGNVSKAHKCLDCEAAIPVGVQGAFDNLRGRWLCRACGEAGMAANPFLPGGGSGSEGGGAPVDLAPILDVLGRIEGLLKQALAIDCKPATVVRSPLQDLAERKLAEMTKPAESKSVIPF